MANAILNFHFLLTIPLAGLPLLKNFPIKRLLARWSSRKNRTTSLTTTPPCCSLSRTWDGNVVDVVGEGRRRATRWWEIVLLLNILMHFTVQNHGIVYMENHDMSAECTMHIRMSYRPGAVVKHCTRYLIIDISYYCRCRDLVLVCFASSLSSVPKSSFSIYLTTIRKLLCFVGIFK